MASSYDIGSGRITGFFTGGRPDVAAEMERAVTIVSGLGPFVQLDVPIVGTDNYDFMMQGIPNLVANQEPASYGPNYHARSDTFDKVDLRQLRINAAIAAAVTWAFAESDVRLPRHSRTDIEALMKSTDLSAQMKSMGMWNDWASGVRGRQGDSGGDGDSGDKQFTTESTKLAEKTNFLFSPLTPLTLWRVHCFSVTPLLRSSVLTGVAKLTSAANDLRCLRPLRFLPYAIGRNAQRSAPSARAAC